MYTRVEDKYLVNDAYIELIKLRLGEVMDLDAHTGKGAYLIRSLYFDDYRNSMLNEVEDGTNNRYKLRIRTYNNDSSYINYEKKSKISGFTHKESVRIDKTLVEKILKSSEIFNAAALDIELKEDTHELIKQLMVEVNTRLLHPVAIVEYERTAYVEAVGNVRITIDRNISGSKDVQSFFDECIESYPVLPPGKHILEIKYDDMLPAYIKDLINIGQLTRISYSKYYMARRNPIIC